MTGKDKELRIAGLMLYRGEGTKYGNNVFDLANSYPEMIKFFLQMLRRIYGILEEKLRVLLYCYADQNVDELKKFWVKVTDINEKQFIKPYIRQDYKESKKGKMSFGLIHVRYHDKKLYNLLRVDTENIVSSFS